MGQPQGGFPKDLQALVLKGQTAITCRPGEHLPDADFDAVKAKMEAFCPNPTMRDVVSYCLYDKVIEEYYAHLQEYSDLTNLDTRVFFNGLAPGGTTEVEIDDGKVLLIKLVHIGDLDDENQRGIIFELNGFRREISVQDKKAAQSAGGVKGTPVLAANPEDPKDVGATLPGMISKLMVKEGDPVKQGDIVAVIEAMKMETTIVCKADGVISKIHVRENQPVKAGELLMKLA